jgi:circadian clock protein KaiB
VCWFDFGCETFGLTETSTLKTKKTSRSKPATDEPPARKSARKFVLRLYVAGATARSRQAVLRVRELCAAELKSHSDLKVIDIYQQPELARAQQIVATPTLVIEFPRPVRRFIGNLANTAGLFVELDVTPKGKIAL